MGNPTAELRHVAVVDNTKNKTRCAQIRVTGTLYDKEGGMTVRGLLEKYPTFGREKETGLPGALDT